MSEMPLPYGLRFYDDGLAFATTPLLQVAERAYHEAFVAAAREAAGWDPFDEGALVAAWAEVTASGNAWAKRTHIISGRARGRSGDRLRPGADRMA